MVNKKNILICIFLALGVIAIIIGFKIKDLKHEEVLSQNTYLANIVTDTNIQNTNNSTVKEDVQDSSNQILEQEKQNIPENTYVKEKGTNVQGEEEESSNKENIENFQEKAISLVKKEWGEDSTVYYTVDNHQDNIYTISVRSKSTTATVAEYEVDAKSGQVNIK